MSVVLNMPKFRVKQGSHYKSVTQRSEYDRICHDSGLNVTLVLNIPEFWIWQGSEYARVKQGYKYATDWPNMSYQDVNMPEYVWIYNNGQGSEYASYNLCNT